jgi:hypothetical protein
VCVCVGGGGGGGGGGGAPRPPPPRPADSHAGAIMSQRPSFFSSTANAHGYKPHKHTNSYCVPKQPCALPLQAGATCKPKWHVDGLARAEWAEVPAGQRVE